MHNVPGHQVIQPLDPPVLRTSNSARAAALTQARLDGEGNWTRDLLDRLDAGEHWFSGEPNPPWPQANNADAARRTPR